MILIAGLLVAWLLIRPGQPGTLWVSFQTGDDILRIIGPLGLLPLCLAGSGPLWKWTTLFTADARTAKRWFPLVVGLSVLGFIAGQVIAAYFAIVLHGGRAGHPVSVPSAADVGFLSSYLFLLAAILLLPSNPLSLASRTRLFLDTTLIMTGIAAFSWYFILGPTILREHDALVVKLVDGAYPLGDIFIVCCLLVALALRRERSTGWMVTFGVALIILTGADSIREYQILHGMTTSGRQPAGTILDVARPVAFMLLCLAAGAVGSSATAGPAPVPTGTGLAADPGKAPGGHPLPFGRGRALAGKTPSAWRYLLPYCSVPVVVSLMIYAARSSGDPRLAYGVYIAGALLIELVLLHQFLDYRELISLASRSARLENLASADPVTGLPNHRTVVSALDREVARSRRYRHSCALLFMDLDYFKALNDSCGHPAGDAALREFASVVRSALRDLDILGRWGGEEFVALLPETDGNAALGVAERVRFAVAAHTFWAAGGAHLTCSIGAAAYPRDADSRDVLVEKADQAMYVAKRLGRNQVRTATDPAVAALLGAAL